MTIRVAVNGRFTTQRLTGVQRYASEVTLRLARRDEISMRVLAPRRTALQGHGAGLDEHLVRGGVLGGHAWEQLELPRLVSGAEVLWSPGNVGPLWAGRHVVTIHDLVSILHPEWVGRRFHLWYRTLLPRVAERASHIVAVSHHTRNQVQDVLGVEDARVTVIPEGVGDSFAPAGADRIRAVRSAHGLPEHYVLALGSLEPRKNLPRLIEAWSRVPPRRRLPLVIAGGSGDPQVFGRTSVARVVARADVHLVGYVPDAHLAGLYSGASAFVYPSLEEGFGLPPLEAIACHTPTITSATSAMAENCRGIATLVDPYEVDDLGDAIDRLCQSPPSPSVREAAAARVRTKFDWSTTAARLARVLGDHAAH